LTCVLKKEKGGREKKKKEKKGMAYKKRKWDRGGKEKTAGTWNSLSNHREKQEQGNSYPEREVASKPKACSSNSKAVGGMGERGGVF